MGYAVQQVGAPCAVRLGYAQCLYNAVELVEHFGGVALFRAARYAERLHYCVEPVVYRLILLFRLGSLCAYVVHLRLGEGNVSFYLVRGDGGVDSRDRIGGNYDYRKISALCAHGVFGEFGERRGLFDIEAELVSVYRIHRRGQGFGNAFLGGGSEYFVVCRNYVCRKLIAFGNELHVGYGEPERGEVCAQVALRRKPVGYACRRVHILGIYYHVIAVVKLARKPFGKGVLCGKLRKPAARNEALYVFAFNSAVEFTARNIHRYLCNGFLAVILQVCLIERFAAFGFRIERAAGYIDLNGKFGRVLDYGNGSAVGGSTIAACHCRESFGIGSERTAGDVGDTGADLYAGTAFKYGFIAAYVDYAVLRVINRGAYFAGRVELRINNVYDGAGIVFAAVARKRDSVTGKHAVFNGQHIEIFRVPCNSIFKTKRAKEAHGRTGSRNYFGAGHCYIGIFNSNAVYYDAFFTVCKYVRIFNRYIGVVNFNGFFGGACGSVDIYIYMHIFKSRIGNILCILCRSRPYHKHRRSDTLILIIAFFRILIIEPFNSYPGYVNVHIIGCGNHVYGLSGKAAVLYCDILFSFKV